MNILLTGSNGQLGKEMNIVCKDSRDMYIFKDVIDISEESIDILRKLASQDDDNKIEHLDITKLDTIHKLSVDKRLILLSIVQPIPMLMKTRTTIL